MIRLSACLFLRYQAHGRLFSHCQAHCLSSLSLSGSYSLTIRLTACLHTLTRRLAAYLFCHCCSYPFSHSDWLPIYWHFVMLYSCTLKLAAICSCTFRLAYLISHLGPGPIYSCMHYRACSPAYSQAHCLCILKLTAYLLTSSLPMYSQAHCSCILRLTAHVFLGSLHI